MLLYHYPIRIWLRLFINGYSISGSLMTADQRICFLNEPQFLSREVGYGCHCESRGEKTTRESQEEGRKTTKSRHKNSKSMAVEDNDESKERAIFMKCPRPPCQLCHFPECYGRFMPHEGEEVMNQKYPCLREPSGLDKRKYLKSPWLCCCQGRYQRRRLAVVS